MAVIIPIISQFKQEGLEEAKRSIKEAEGGWNKLRAGSAAAMKPAVGILTGLAASAGKFASEAAGAAQANKALATSFNAVGYPENAKAAQDYADSLSRTIGVQDEEIKQTMRLLTAYDATASSSDTMGRVTLAAANMASTGFGTMDSSAKLLGKALEDPTKGINALFRAGVTFTDQQKDQIKTMQATGDMAGAQAIVLEQVEKTFKGAAEANKSAADDAKIAWGEAQEALGEKLLPIFKVFLDLLVKGADFIAEHATVIVVLAGVFATLATAIIAINIAFKVYDTVMRVAAVATKIMGAATKSALGPIGLIIAAVALLAVLIISNWDWIKATTEKVWKAITDFMKKAWDSITKVFNTSLAWIKNACNTAWNFIKGIFKSNPFTAIKGMLDSLKSWVGGAFDWVKTKINAVWNWIKGIFKTNPFASIKAHLDKLQDWFRSAFDWISDKADAFLDKIKGIGKSAKKALDKIVPGGNAIIPVSPITARALPVSASIINGLPVAGNRAVGQQSGSGGGPTINVYGALDPEAVARQIRSLLDSHDRRQGRTVVRAVAF